MVENIERFQPQFQAPRLATERNPFVQREIRLIQSRAVKEIAPCISNDAKRRLRESSGIEPEIVWGCSRIAIDLHWPCHIRHIPAAVEHKRIAGQRRIGAGTGDGYGKSGLQRCNPGNLPTSGQQRREAPTARSAGNLIAVVRDKALTGVEHRVPIVRVRVKRIQSSCVEARVFEVRTDIQRMTPGLGQREGQPMRGAVPQTGLKRVVV